MTSNYLNYDVLVIGGGHAGCEAALAAARLGAKTLLLTINNDHIAQMSCNPAIGGIAKGHVVREIDALGGEMGRNTDASTIQFRMLNQSKGPAVLSPRAQCDKVVYQRRMKLVLERQENLLIHQAQAVSFETAGDQVCGVRTEFGDVFLAKAVVVCTGTFLNAKLHYGLVSQAGGRAGDVAAIQLAESLRKDLGLETARLKTGTPVRVLAGTIDFSSLERQDADSEGKRFSFRQPDESLPNIGGEKLDILPCYTTRTNDATAQAVRDNLDRSPLYSGKIDATGTRYCPSFEDKVVRFPDRNSHHVYLEPEGMFTDEYYLNGISTSLPIDVQWLMVRSLPGLEKAHISRYAYAIEYDFVQPRQLQASLATRRWPNLFLAGQINGTSGYEEAGGQGLMAGLNAARFAGNLGEGVVLRRDQAYIGVMIDDLVTKEIVEPYRLFTSRAEYRLLLRQDNADRRLMPLAHSHGLLSDSDYSEFTAREKEINETREFLQTARKHGLYLWEHLRRQEVSYEDLEGVPAVSAHTAEQLKIEALYEGYTQRQNAQAKNLHKLDAWKIPEGFDYGTINGLRFEARAKLEARRPATLGQASRIDGVTPAEIALLQVHLNRLRK